MRVKVDMASLVGLPQGRVDEARIAATTEAEIAAHIAVDETAALQESAKFARHVRKRLGLTQAEFSRRIDVSLDTIRNWEQAKRRPTGAARVLLKVLDKAPDAALLALT